MIPGEGKKEGSLALTHQRFLHLSLLLLLPVIYFGWALRSGCTFFRDDICRQFYPYRELLLRMGKAHTIFLWNPYQFSGIPLAGNIQFGLFYPLNLLFYFLPTGKALILFTIIHYIVAGVSMYLYLVSLGLRRAPSICGAILFMFSGFMILHTIHPPLLAATAWLPALVLCWDLAMKKRFYLLLGAVIFGVQLLAGSPPVSLLSVLLLVYLSFWRGGSAIARGRREGAVLPLILQTLWREMIAFVLPVLLGCALSAIEILPAAFVASQVARVRHTYPDFASTYALLPSRVASLLIPEIDFNTLREHISRGEPTETDVYLGLVPFLLLLFSPFTKFRHRWCFLALAGLSFLLSLGSRGGLYSLLLLVLSPMGYFRAPVRFLLIFIFCCCVLCASTLQHIQEKLRSLKQVPHLFAILILVELWVLASGANPLVREEAYSQPDFFERLMHKHGMFRILTVPDFPFHLVNWGMRYGISNIIGYDPLVPDYYMEYLFFNESGGLPPREWWTRMIDSNHALTIKRFDTNMLKLLNLRYVLSAERQDGNVEIREIPRSFPRFFFVSRFQVIPDKEKMLSLLADERFDPQSTVLLEKHPGVDLAGTHAKAEIEVLAYDFNGFSLKVKNEGDGILVASEIYFPGWKCKVDGDSALILKADYILRAVFLKSGTHLLKMSYEPPSFKWGAAITILAILLVGTGFILSAHES